MLKTFISPKLKPAESSIMNFGLKTYLVAKENISEGEILSIRFGEILKKSSIPKYTWIDYFPLSDDYVLGPSKNVSVEDQILFIQHSCNPNSGIRGEVTLVARRDIQKGEEINADYATIDNEDYSYKCKCGYKDCRNIVTGYDWKKPEVQSVNNGWFVKYLQEKIDKVDSREEKIVLVIGASGGIGHGVAKSLLDKYKVIGTHYKRKDVLTDLEDNPRFTPFELDLSKTKSIEKLSEHLFEKNIQLYTIINCSGIVLFEENDQGFEVWNKTIDINLTSNYKIHKLLSKHIVDKGNFIMISSTDASYGTASALSYAVSKAGINSLTKSLAHTYSDRKIRVNSIAPGWVETEMMDQSGDELVEYAANINPLKRNGDPNDIADLAVYLISDENGYVNGQVITIDGGYANQDATLIFESQLLEAKKKS